MSLWRAISECLRAGPRERELAEELLAEFRALGVVERTQSSLAAAPDAALAVFFEALASERSSASPVADEADSSWALKTDFCFVNARAAGYGARPGSFLAASKLLPAIRPKAIHLAPFHPCHFDVIYAIESPALIDRGLLDPRLEAAGLGAADQLRAFVEAAHLLGKAVGYDLVPHVAQYARTVLEEPELFRWVELGAERLGLAPGLDPEAIGSGETRRALSAKVRSLVATVKAQHGIADIEAEHADPAARERMDRAYFAGIKALVDAGLWPILSHAWNGIGLPEFHRYDRAGNYPVFRYRGESGEDVGEAAYSVVAPFAFHDGLPPNRRPDSSRPPERHDAATEYFGRLFDRWRDDFGFDFVRVDSVDHVLDSTLDEAGRLPISDRPSPETLGMASILLRDRVAARRIAILAERMGAEIEGYAAMGFDLLLGSDMLRRVDRPLLEDAFRLQDRIAAFNATASRPVSVCFALDTHDSGSPRLWGQPLVHAMSPERLALRHFVARFSSCGAGRRPLYEVMGFQDRSWGLYDANVSTRNLAWENDEAAARAYALVERAYERHRAFLDQARIAERFVEDGLAWWILRGRDASRCLVAVAALETAEGRDRERFTIPLGQPTQAQYDCTAEYFEEGEAATLCVRGELPVDGLRFLRFRLYDLRQAFY